MIKSLGLAIAAVLALAAAPALAADKPAAPDLKVEAKNHDQGQKEVPAVVQAAKLPCTVTDGYFIAETNIKDEKGKEVKAKVYETACKEGLGYILLAPAAGDPKTYDCITTSTNASLHCRLPSNLDNKIAGAALASAAGKTCSVSDVRPMGATAAGDAFYEIGCSDRLGFVVKRAATGKEDAFDCAQNVGSNIECKLTTVEQIKAAEAKAIASLVAASGKSCTLKDSRTIGALTSGNTGYEVACTDGQGYVLLAKPDGTLANAIGCANADSIAGGCKLTNVQEAQTQEAATYTTLAKKAGFDCTVDKYHYIGLDKDKAEVVELHCANRPDGAIGLLPADNSPGRVYDCVHAGAIGAACHLSSPSAVYDRYTQILASKGRGTCKVSNAQALGRYTSGDMIEVACSDGLPGWVIELSPQTSQASELLSCGQARSAGIVCKLPGNTK